MTNKRDHRTTRRTHLAAGELLTCTGKPRGDMPVSTNVEDVDCVQCLRKVFGTTKARRKSSRE